MSRRTAVLAVGVVYVAAVVLVPSVGAPAPPGPQPVSVVNFPAVQPVSGTVNVGNLPAVQGVTGTVEVGNLPLDGEGNVKVIAAATPATHFAGYTQATFAEGSHLLTLNRACEAEYPGTTTCDAGDLLVMSPPPPPPTTVAMLIRAVGTVGGTLMTVPLSTCMSAEGQMFSCGAAPLPIACCGN
jgi:hypothetical protein